MKRISCWILIMMIIVGVSYAKKVATLTEITNPFKFRVDQNNFYISEGIKVFIYSLKDYKLIKQFGKEGEGPGEVLLDRREGNTQVALQIEPKQILVRSISKIIYFTKEGKFIKEKRTASAGNWLIPFADGFIGKKLVNGSDKILYQAIYFFDSALKQVKEICKEPTAMQGPTIPFNPLLTKGTKLEVYENKLFVLDVPKSVINAYDKTGKKVLEIEGPEKNISFTESDKQKMIAEYNINKAWKLLYETKKNLFKFPDYYPPINDFEIDPVAKKIYMATEKIENENRKWIVFDMKGKKDKEIFLPSEGVFQFYNGICYALIENEDGEWEMHIF